MLVAVAALVAFGAAVAILAFGGRDTATKAEYRAAVTNARDRVDYALGRLTKAKSLNQLLDRMDEAAGAIDDAANDVDRKKPPARFEKEHAKLTRSLHTLSTDVQGTADQAREPGFEDILFGAHGLSFDSWNDVNAALEALRKKGLRVPLLVRQTTS